jgi:mRNA-degrading endonuclease HigB of HigAB toxin-antitoxin module
MRIIAEKTLKTYWEKEPLAQQQLVAWLKNLKEATFQNHNELKE